jgi:hypothetical protein
MTSRMKIVVSGVIAGVPDQGGAAWAVLQWALGLMRLGHEVTLVEQVDGDGFAATAPRFTELAAGFGLERRAALVDGGSGATVGLSRAELVRAVDGADLLLNISGTLTDDELFDAPRRRAFVDLDPAFTQLWHDVDGVDMGFDRHDLFVTIGRQIGEPECPVPSCGRRWTTTPQPIILEHWPVCTELPTYGLTTVGHWRSYGSIYHDGVHYGQKAHSLRRLFGLPSLDEGPFELALGIHPDEREDLAALHSNGWRLLPPLSVAGTPASYQRFVQRSWGELGVAKLGYVASRCGWFSDRSVCYLASGRPVVAQDTAFAAWLETGAGLFAFATAQEAAAAIDEIRSDYAAHARAARALAESVFDSDRVLGDLLECL